MSITSHKASEALFIIIIRDKNAEQQLKAWVKSANVHATVESSRMKIYEQRVLSLFQINWPYDWELVTIWDCWNRRHIYT
jgi:hypothetical protein